MTELQGIRYVNLQPTSTPSGYQQTAALPDAASSIARNAIWPKKIITFPIIVVPVDGRIMSPVDAPQIRVGN
jgi:hypothetical protein